MIALQSSPKLIESAQRKTGNACVMRSPIILCKLHKMRHLYGLIRAPRIFILIFIGTLACLLLSGIILLSSSDKKIQVGDHWSLKNSKVLRSQNQNSLNSSPIQSKSGYNDPVFTQSPKGSNSDIILFYDDQLDVSREVIAAVLVIAAKRAAAVSNHIKQLVKLRPEASHFPIIISQDGNNDDVTASISKFVNESAHVFFIQHKDREYSDVQAGEGFRNYFNIAQHYKWALDKIFFEMKYETVIITEDDLDLADDFFQYFTALKNLLFVDRTIWCISAWNDNGGVNITDRKHGKQLYRTDFFPGLGWMMRLDLWKELSNKWPKAYWDDWMRTPKVRRERVCIRPEVSRTSHNNNLAGKGSSGGLYKKYLESVRLPEKPDQFTFSDLTYLIKSQYDRELADKLLSAKMIKLEDIEKGSLSDATASLLVVYSTPREYRRLAKAVGLMIDIRSGMPRTAYYGIVTFMVGNARYYAIPNILNIHENFGMKPSTSYYNEKWDKMTRFLDFQEAYCRPTKFTGVCDPKNPELIAWFAKKRLTKRLQAWGEMIVN